MNAVRTVSDTKRDFYKVFPKPVSQVYRRVVDELLVEMHLLVVNQTFVYDSIFALGVVTAFDRFMSGYKPEADCQTIFRAVCTALQFDSDQLRRDAAHLSELAMRSPSDVKSLLTTLETSANLDPLAAQIRAIASNPKFKYSRLFCIGLFALLEAADPQAIADNDKRQELLKQVGEALKIGADRPIKDLDLYRSNLEKLEQARLMMADLAEAERKKRAQRANQAKTTNDAAQDAEGATVESQESTSAESN